MAFFAPLVYQTSMLLKDACIRFYPLFGKQGQCDWLHLCATYLVKGEFVNLL